MPKQNANTLVEAATKDSATKANSGKPAEIRAESKTHSPVQTGWEVVVGRIAALTNSAEPLVTIPHSEGVSPVKARTIVAVGEKEVGKQVVLAFEEGDMARPIVLGVVQTAPPEGNQASVVSDGNKFVVTAEREIELRCGQASITLTRAGKVLIKGEYVLSASSGVNRIRGGSVQIN